MEKTDREAEEFGSEATQTRQDILAYNRLEDKFWLGHQRCSPGQTTISAWMPPDTNMKLTCRVMVLFSHPANVLSFLQCCLGLLQLPLSSITNASTVSRTQKIPQDIVLAAFFTQNSPWFNCWKDSNSSQLSLLLALWLFPPTPEPTYWQAQYNSCFAKHNIGSVIAYCFLITRRPLTPL